VPSPAFAAFICAEGLFAVCLQVYGNGPETASARWLVSNWSGGRFACSSNAHRRGA
jgi:hypothetical protein